MGINSINGEELECFGDNLFDPFEGTRMNECVDNELQRTVNFASEQYLAPVKMEVRTDPDYQQYCARRLTSNFVDFDYFTTQITTNILHSDVCGVILDKIHDKYTTTMPKYTTKFYEYNYESVKPAKYIERYASNIPNIQNVEFDENARDNDAVTPMFDPFERYEVIAPLFDPWSSREANDEESTPPPPPTLTLTDKQLSYTCFYSVPTFKLSACNVIDDHIKEAIRDLRANASADENCRKTLGLANIINTYAYLGDGIGCRSVFDADTGIRVIASEGKLFDNIATQSNDGIKYNKWVHSNGDIIMACPDHIMNDGAFACDLEDNRIYYLQDLH